MGFLSIWFLIFLPVVLIGHNLLPKKFKWVLLLLASYLFYGFYEPYLLLIIISSTLVSFLCGKLIYKYRYKFVLFASVLMQLSFLLYFKYANFMIDLISDLYNLFDGQLDISSRNIILPIGISFYTFQSISYVVDIYKKRIAPEEHLGHFALFLVFFPQLVAGPIEKPQKLIPQLKTTINLTWNNFSEGSKLILLGYLKKVVIADTLIKIINQFQTSSFYSSSTIEVWIISVAFAYYIYADFSGYCDIAMGLARYFGVELSPNFIKPFSSINLREFWAKWHASLSNWIKAYLFQPLGGIDRRSKLRTLFNVMTVFLIMGLWHGASYNFLLFGFFGGFFIILDYSTKDLRKRLFKKINLTKKNRFSRFIFRFTVVNLFAFLAIFFNANSLDESILGLEKIFSFSFFVRIGMNQIIIITSSIIILELINYYTPKGLFHPFNSIKLPSLRIATYSLVFLVISLFFFNNKISFYYFQF